MKSSKEIRAEIAKLSATVQAIVQVAKEEERDFTAEEQSTIDAIQGHGEVAGQLPELEATLDRSLRYEAHRDAIIRNVGDSLGKPKDYELDTPAIENVRVPAKARIHGNLKAFKGETAERDAYVAGQVILAGIYNSQPAIEFCRNHGLIQNTMTGGSDGLKGGFLVPDEMSSAIVRLREERGVFPQFANSVPMGSDNITIPRLITDVTAYWTGEGDEITASDAELGAAELTAKKLACLTKVSSELDQDAVVAVGDMITTSMAYAMADKIDEAGFNGDGTSTYGGVVGLANALNSAAIQDAVSGNVSAATLDLADFEKTLAKYPQYAGASPRWFINSAAYWNSMARLLNAAGGNAISDLTGTRQMMFLGYPVTFAQVMSAGAAVSTVVAYFGDLRLGASLGTRQSVRTQVSVDRYFESDLIGIRCTERIAINVHERGDTVRTRPIVALKTAAS